jgi:uncharacterized protein (DUF1501 family)
MDRRDFVKLLGSGTIAMLGAPSPSRAFEVKHDLSQATADHIIWITMAGGMAHTETFDPKAYTPYEKGLHASKVLSTFPSIPTSVDELFLSKGLENLAQVMHLGTLIRSYQAADLGHILHTKHQYHFHTSYQPPQSVNVPHIAAWVSHEIGGINPVLPNWINIGQQFVKGEKEELKLFHSAGFLGAQHGPFVISDPRESMSSVNPPPGMDISRFEKRNRIYREMLTNSPYADVLSDYQIESFQRSMQQAYALVKSPSAKAFDLSQETQEVHSDYGESKFAKGCLMARRLVEHGARFVTVSTDYIPFKGWDTHKDGHRTAKKMKETIDRPIAQLIKDLELRGLLERTIVFVGTEFSRDSMIEGRLGQEVNDQAQTPNSLSDISHYGMHRHFTDGISLLAFGGGFKRGLIYGRTADERPCKVVDNPIRIDDIHQTIYHALGISKGTHAFTEQRPFYTTPDGKGKARKALLQSA